MKNIVSREEMPDVEKITKVIKSMPENTQERMLAFLEGVQFAQSLREKEPQR